MSKENLTGKPGFITALSSPIGRKILTGVTGLGLVIFAFEHMIANLTYFSSDPNAYNSYTHFLMSLGPLLYFAEVVILVGIVLHIYLGISIYLGMRRARPDKYKKYMTAGKPSLQTFSSKSMVVTGLMLLIFLVIHLMTFKYGPSVAEGYVVNVDGEQIRDLKRLVGEKFQNPFYTFGYIGVMALLGFHLRHGVWSALQSIGAMNPKWTPAIYTLAAITGVLVAVGFLVLPLWIYFGLL